MESARDPLVRRAHRDAGMVVPDGMPLVWLLRRAGHRETQRVYGPDLMLAVFARAQAAGWRHYLYGSSPDVLRRLEANLRRRFPGALIAGAYAPPFRPPGAAEEDRVIAEIDGSGADILWVGLSTPKQELWMTQHRSRLRTPVLVGVGAAFDFHAGLLRQAPPVVQKLGLEWAFRLAMEPRRLFGRYARIVPGFLALLVAEKLGWRRLRDR